MAANRVSLAPPATRSHRGHDRFVLGHVDDSAPSCGCSSSHKRQRSCATTPADPRSPRRRRSPVKPRRSFVALAVGTAALMASGVTAAAAAAPRPDGATASLAVAMAASPLHLPALTRDAGHDHDAPQQLQVDTDTITQFSRELGLVKRDPRPGDKDDPSGSWHEQIQKRDSASSSSSSSSSSSKSSSTSSSSETKSSSTSEASSSPLPSPFDNTPLTAFKSPSGGDDSCPSFIKSLLADSTFKSCVPVSMLVRNSISFFRAQKQLTSITRVLDAACAADSSSCADFMEKAAKNLIDDSNCKKEYNDGQEKVLDALNGLRAYSVMYSATCLQNPDADASGYCYAMAVTNTSNPSDSYYYSLPLNFSLPGSSTPSCGWCTSQTMAIFHSATSDDAQAIAATYPEAARQINTICGPDFVNGTALSAAPRGLMPSVNSAVAATLATLVLTLGGTFLL